MMRWPARPSLSRAFYKAHGLGNDYLVFEEGPGWFPSPERVALVCDPHRGVGAEGIVALLAERADGVARLRMFNPDGGEFERSGNGLRVLGSFLARRGERSPFRVTVGGDEVRLLLHGADAGRYDLSVEMGAARIGAEAVGLDPLAIGAQGALAGPAGEALTVVPVSVGNPHLVVVGGEVTAARLERVGPFLAAHPSLARGANVQLAEVTGEDACRVLVWERGVGPTAASGTSACAVAAALVSSRRLAPGAIRVSMPGGSLSVHVGEGLDLVLRGPIEEVCTGRLAAALAGGP